MLYILSLCASIARYKMQNKCPYVGLYFTLRSQMSNEEKVDYSKQIIVNKVET